MREEIRNVALQYNPDVSWMDTDTRKAGRPPSAMVLREKATIDKPGGLHLVTHQGARNRSEMPCRAKGSERLTGPMAARAPATVLRVCVCDDIPGMGQVSPEEVVEIG